jgi:di/tripeptidase
MFPTHTHDPLSQERLDELSQFAFQVLQRVVAIDSASDEASTSIPSTIGQSVLAQRVAQRLTALDADVIIDEYATLIAKYPGRGQGANAPPLAFMIHLDTAKGTEAVPLLHTIPKWNGRAIPFSKNPALKVSVTAYPSLNQFKGHTVVHGPGDAPFGLDDKLGLTHLLTLAWLIHSDPLIHDLPPIWLIGRPDEEIGREEALIGLAKTLAEAGVSRGYTVDGIEPFEVNVANFNGAGAQLYFARALDPLGEGLPIDIHLGGVNTHGATAYAEGHRSVTRFMFELWAKGQPLGLRCCGFEHHATRECDGVWRVWAPDLSVAARLRRWVDEQIGPHEERGASARFEEGHSSHADRGLEAALMWGHQLIESEPGFPLLAEDSHGWSGYTHPFRLRCEEARWRLDLRIRDFTAEGIERRVEHIGELANPRSDFVGSSVSEWTWAHQYRNMEPLLAEAPELVMWAIAGAQAVNQSSQVLPIRGGTGVEAFLEAGVMVANLGTGYFSPESEKELTSLEWMALHGLWLLEIARASLDPHLHPSST